MKLHTLAVATLLTGGCGADLEERYLIPSENQSPLVTSIDQIEDVEKSEDAHIKTDPPPLVSSDNFNDVVSDSEQDTLHSADPDQIATAPSYPGDNEIYEEPRDPIETPYFAQRNNTYEPGGTCGLTSASMLLGYWKPDDQITPDGLYLQYGKRKGQSPDTLANLYWQFGLDSNYSYTGTRDDIKDLLDRDIPVIVHGWFTRAGHIVLIVGYNDDGFIVNDPAGNWARCYKCGYGGLGSGEGVLYTYEQMSNSVLGSDGDIWMSYAY